MGQSLTHSKHIGAFNLQFAERVSVSVVREATLSEDLDAISSRRFQHIELVVGKTDPTICKMKVKVAKAWRDLLDKAITDAESVPDLEPEGGGGDGTDGAGPGPNGT